jgi:hypothetical protein
MVAPRAPFDVLSVNILPAAAAEQVREQLWRLVMCEYARNQNIHFMLADRTGQKEYDSPLFSHLRRLSYEDKRFLREYLAVLYRRHHHDHLHSLSPNQIKAVAQEVIKRLKNLTTAPPMSLMSRRRRRRRFRL